MVQSNTIFITFLIIFSNAISVHQMSVSNMRAPTNTNSLSKTSPSSGFTISLKKKTDYDKVAAYSFIAEIQNSIGKFKTCKNKNIS